ncbi:hypothetical protein B0H19DRAFT_1076646 [Mycena capillaripes]|nr:hypothetical protein B0H19DRAFT_1076646 [Mycena capillaripes]
MLVSTKAPVIGYRTYSTAVLITTPEEDAPDIRANTWLSQVTNEQLKNIGFGFLAHQQRGLLTITSIGLVKVVRARSPRLCVGQRGPEAVGILPLTVPGQAKPIKADHTSLFPTSFPAMDATALCRFVKTNVDWPVSNCFFIPMGGLLSFLQTNLRFKVFLVAMPIFVDAYAADTVKSLTTPHRDQLRRHVRDIVRHMFFAAQIRQNEFRIEYTPPAVPTEAAWMFHVILVLLVVVGFEGEDNRVADSPGPLLVTEGQVAQAQSIPINDTLSDAFKYNAMIARWYEQGVRPDGPKSLAVAAGIAAAADLAHRAAKRVPTRRSMRVLAGKITAGVDGGDGFFLSKEERALSKASVIEPPLASGHKWCDRSSICSPIISHTQPMPRGPLSEYRHYFEGLLLTDEELLRRDYEPNGTLDLFFRTRIRPAVYFLQRCTINEHGLEGPRVTIPPTEREELQEILIRLLGTLRILAQAKLVVDVVVQTRFFSSAGRASVAEHKYRVPAVSLNMLQIIAKPIPWLLDNTPRHNLVYRITEPALLCFIDATVDDLGNPDTDTKVVLRCNIATVGELFTFANHPFLAKISREVLKPLYQFFLLIREDFTCTPENKSKTERRVTRQRVREYLVLAVHFSIIRFLGEFPDRFLVVSFSRLVRYRHMPIPRVAWLQVVMRADASYGFEGDENSVVRVILRGKLASLYQYSEMLRRDTFDRLVILDDASHGFKARAPVNGKIPFEDLSPYLPYHPPRGLEAVVAVDHNVAVRLDCFRGTRVERHKFTNSRGGVYEFVARFVCLYRALIASCIPSATLSPGDLPEGCIGFLRPHVIAYVQMAFSFVNGSRLQSLLYTIALDTATNLDIHLVLDSSFVWALSQARTFDFFVNHPTEGYSSNTRLVFFGRINSALALANHDRPVNAPLNIPLSPDILSHLHVPSWTRVKIEALRKLETRGDLWACEQALLEDELERSRELGRALEKLDQILNHIFVRQESARDCFRHLEGPMPGRAPRSLDLADPPFGSAAAPYYDNRSGVGYSLGGRLAHQEAAKVLTGNMLVLEKTSVERGMGSLRAGKSTPFVPGEGTALFGMVERFIDLYGFIGDGSVFDQALLFQRLARLQSVMIASPDYLQRAIDFPNFPLSDEYLRWYGIFDFIKPHQLAQEGITHTYVHRFGDSLLCYNPELGEEKRYKFPDPALETLPTRPNTPLSGPRIILQLEGEVSDADTEPLPESIWVVATVVDRVATGEESLGTSLVAELDEEKENVPS